MGFVGKKFPDRRLTKEAKISKNKVTGRARSAKDRMGVWNGSGGSDRTTCDRSRSFTTDGKRHDGSYFTYKQGPNLEAAAARLENLVIIRYIKWGSTERPEVGRQSDSRD